MWLKVAIAVAYCVGCFVGIHWSEKRSQRKKDEFQKHWEDAVNANLAKRVEENNRRAAMETRVRLHKMFSLPPED